MAAKIGAAPSGENTTLAGTESFPITGSQFVKISTLKAFALATATLTGHPTIEGVTLTGATGTGLLVFNNAPTLIAPTLGNASVTNLAVVSGGITFSGNISASGLFSTAGIRHKSTAATFNDTQASTTIATAYTNVFGGNTWTAANTLVITNAFTAYFFDPTAGSGVTMTNKWALGVDSLKIGTSGTFTVSPAGVVTASVPIAATSIATMTATVGGGVPTPPNNTTTFLRGDGTFAAPVGGITIGAAITGGTTTRLLYDNAGVVGESTVTTDGANLTVSGAPFAMTGNISAASWGGAAISNIVGVRFKNVAGTFTDTSTAASGTVVNGATNIFGRNTIASTNASVVYTNYFGSYFKNEIAGAPIAITNNWALGADSIRITGLGTALQVDNSVLIGGILFVGSSVTSQASLLVGVGLDSTYLGFTSFPVFGKLSTSNIRLGAAASATPLAQTFTIGEASRPGTDSNVGGANGTLQSGLGTGTGTLSTLALQSPIAVGSGTGVQTQTTGFLIRAGTGVLTSYIVANLPAAATAGAGATAFVTDASTTLILGLGGTVTGGGANKVPVFSDGTNWIYG